MDRRTQPCAAHEPNQLDGWDQKAALCDLLLLLASYVQVDTANDGNHIMMPDSDDDPIFQSALKFLPTGFKRWRVGPDSFAIGYRTKETLAIGKQLIGRLLHRCLNVFGNHGLALATFYLGDSHTTKGI
jgi:hypothetical protein